MELSNKFDDDVEDVDDEDGDDDDARKGNGNVWLSAFNIFWLLGQRPKTLGIAWVVVVVNAL